MLRYAGLGSLVWLLAASAAFGQQGTDRVELGRFAGGAIVSFVHAAEGGWGIEIAGGVAPRLVQPKPARLEVFRTEGDTRQLAAGYKTVQRRESGVDALADIPCGNDVVFRVQDRWTLSGTVVSVDRKVNVTGSAEGGFTSSVMLTVDPSVAWSDVNCLAPGLLYGDPTYDGARSPGGTQNHAARRFLMR